MRKGPRTIQPHATRTNDGADDFGPFTITSTYLLPTDAHVTLKFLRDELHLLARLAEPRSEDDRDEIVLSTEALSDCFSRLAEQLGEVLSEVRKLD